MAFVASDFDGINNTLSGTTGSVSVNQKINLIKSMKIMLVACVCLTQHVHIHPVATCGSQRFVVKAQTLKFINALVGQRFLHKRNHKKTKGLKTSAQYSRMTYLMHCKTDKQSFTNQANIQIIEQYVSDIVNLRSFIRLSE